MSGLKHAWTNLAVALGSLLAQQTLKLELSFANFNNAYTIKEISSNPIYKLNY
jgi:hypothetical protein